MTSIETTKIAFLGFGNMAQAFADGLLKSGKIRGENLAASAKNFEKLEKNTSSRGMHAFKSNKDAATWADVVVLAVKPYIIPSVVEEVKDLLDGKVVISVAANILFDDYEKMLLPNTHHLTLMPNTPVAINEGVLLCEGKHSLAEDEKAVVDTILGLLGRVIYVDTSIMKAAGTISGCGPAFVAMAIEALADAAVKHGVPRAMAYPLVSQTLAGTAKLQLATDKHPAVMKDAVCSPAGTTIVGVASLERSGFRGALIEAVDAILREKK